jgi:hypothetical protein
MLVKKLIILLMIFNFVPQTVWGNENKKFDFDSYYNLKIIEMSHIDDLYTQKCHNVKTSFTLSDAMSITNKTSCFSSGHNEKSFMIDYHVNKHADNFALTYNTFSVGIAFDVKTYNLGNGQEVKVHKPRVKIDLSGDIDPGYFFRSWELTLNSTSAKKLQERYLPKDSMMRSMLQDNLFNHSLDGSSLKGRVVFIELILTFGV